MVNMVDSDWAALVCLLWQVVGTKDDGGNCKVQGCCWMKVPRV